MPARISEDVDGGVADGDATKGSPDHLVVLVHGILGSATNWKFAAEQFIRILPEKVVVHCSERNASKLTLDGVDVMGERLAEEIKEMTRKMPYLRKISFIAHSVGGLVARYAIGRLYKPPYSETEVKNVLVDGGLDTNLRGTVCGLEPMNFITVATPHLGSRGNKQVPFLFGVPMLEKTACLVIHWIFGRTGRHLFLTDNEEGKLPLLQRMLTDCGDLYFMFVDKFPYENCCRHRYSHASLFPLMLSCLGNLQCRSALRAFRRRVAYANVGYDHIVGWRTASIRRDCELPKWEDSPSERYPHIVCEEVDAEQLEKPLVINQGLDMLEEQLASGLRRVSWERVHVSFHSSPRRFDAHNLIQVKDPFVHSEGVDCILHMIDNFLC